MLALVSVCVCVCLYVCVCIYLYVYVHVSMCVYVFVCVCVYAHVSAPVCMMHKYALYPLLSVRHGACSINEPIVNGWLFIRYVVVGSYVGIVTVLGFVWWFISYDKVGGGGCVYRNRGVCAARVCGLQSALCNQKVLNDWPAWLSIRCSACLIGLCVV
jgi:hypothetical protein